VDGGVLCVGFWMLCCYEGYEGWVEDWGFLLMSVDGVDDCRSVMCGRRSRVVGLLFGFVRLD
jgi:hypothetical protein